MKPQKITFAEMRDMGVRGLPVYCSDYKCSHLITMSGDRWPDDVRLSDLGDAVCLLNLRQARRRCAAGFRLEQEGSVGDRVPLRTLHPFW